LKWLEVSIQVVPEYQELISQIIMEQGIQGIEIIDPEEFRWVLKENQHLDYADDSLIEAYGDKVTIKAYFDACHNIRNLKERLDILFSDYKDKIIEMNICVRDDSEWKDNWKSHYKTFSISKRVIVKPTWEEYTAQKGQVVIEMEPGMAFGTGTHETTQMCAYLLDELIKGNEHVLDLGCGTGILGIIAAKLGAEDVTCADIDETACRTAQQNVVNNNVEKSVRVIHGELKDLAPKTYDIIIINIITNVILSLIPVLKKYCTEQTTILLSGIVQERKQEVVDMAKKYGYRLLRGTNKGEWVAMMLCTDFS
jgi:ribosomal protein L11 methyltransferase